MIGYSKDQQIGKIKAKPTQVERNISANSILDSTYKEKGLFNICEVRVSQNCLKEAKISSIGTKLEMTYAHRHKRQWYKDQDRRKLLSAFTETLRCCLSCHMQIEHDRKLTNRLFTKLRGTQFIRSFEKDKK